MELLKPIVDEYEALLERTQSIDFNDMIGKAINYVESGRFQPTWRYILVDEFQDISRPRARLVKALRDRTRIVRSSVSAMTGSRFIDLPVAT